MLSLDLANNRDSIELLLLSHPQPWCTFVMIGIQARCIVVADLLLSQIFYAAKLPLAGVAVVSVAVNWRSSDCR